MFDLSTAPGAGAPPVSDHMARANAAVERLKAMSPAERQNIRAAGTIHMRVTSIVSRSSVRTVTVGNEETAKPPAPDRRHARLKELIEVIDHPELAAERLMADHQLEAAICLLLPETKERLLAEFRAKLAELPQE